MGPFCTTFPTFGCFPLARHLSRWLGSAEPPTCVVLPSDVSMPMRDATLKSPWQAGPAPSLLAFPVFLLHPSGMHFLLQEYTVNLSQCILRSPPGLCSLYGDAHGSVMFTQRLGGCRGLGMWIWLWVCSPACCSHSETTAAVSWESCREQQLEFVFDKCLWFLLLPVWS